MVERLGRGIYGDKRNIHNCMLSLRMIIKEIKCQKGIVRFYYGTSVIISVPISVHLNQSPSQGFTTNSSDYLPGFDDYQICIIIKSYFRFNFISAPNVS